jgi:ATP-dependent Clp protease ATP-binding subunit ClpA
MDMSVPSLFDQLVKSVIQSAGCDDPLSRLNAAMITATNAADASERLLDHFVGEARHAGRSWTEIGARLGVSKQAARQRFADRTAPLIGAAGAEPDTRLRACLVQAGVVAQADGAAQVATHHLLAGLLAEGVAAAVLERLGVTTDAILSAAHRLFGPPARAREEIPPLSMEAQLAVECAARHAAAVNVKTGGQEVRPEHLLFVLALDAGGRARRVLNELGTDIAAIKRELECYVTGRPRRRGSRWKRPPLSSGPTCSFCGRSENAVGRLVAGPGVRICGRCVALADDVLREGPDRRRA